MKRCLNCNMLYASVAGECPECKEKVRLVDGFDSYAPAFAYEGGGFKSDSFSHLAELEDSSFWFRSRNDLILWALRKYCPGFESFLEVGCGTGYVLSAVKKAFPSSQLSGSEIFTTGLAYAQSRLPSVKLMQMDAREIPFVDEFDVIGAFDVLEHIEEDHLVLKQMYMATRPKGVVMITVPQHEWLWSVTDDYAVHVRRYSAADLHHKMEQAGFRIVRSTSFMFILLPAMMASRFLKKRVTVEEFNPTAELKINPLVSSAFSKLLNIERSLIEWGANFPVGGSRLIIAQKD